MSTEIIQDNKFIWRLKQRYGIENLRFDELPWKSNALTSETMTEMKLSCGSDQRMEMLEEVMSNTDNIGQVVLSGGSVVNGLTENAFDDTKQSDLDFS